ncbi:hypothetical protein [Candidatus Nitrospira bockiana]
MISLFRLRVFFLSPLLLLTATGFSWVPSEQEIQAYRKSWNPFSHGPILLQAVDIQPRGQLSIRPFLFSQIGEHSYGNRLTFATDRRNGPVHLYALAPSLNAAYGLTNHVEVGVASSLNAFWARDSESFNKGRGGPMTADTGLGDTSLIVKYRPTIQDPTGWRPSITLFSQLVLPTSRWITGTEKPPGGFAPFGRLPNTRFGELGLTEGVMYRKNLQPFRVSAAVFYTYAAPGHQGVTTTYTGDVINTRLIVEHLLNDKKGFGYNLEFLTLHGLTWRADGHEINTGQKSGFSVFGVEPVIQYKFSESLVAAAGILFVVAGQNAIDAIHPNFSIFWYWSKTGKVLMR